MRNTILRLAVQARHANRDERGATATEYGLLVAFIAFIIIAGVTLFGGALRDWFGQELAGEVGSWVAP